jgi:branched-chain amino acid aminotransferase
VSMDIKVTPVSRSRIGERRLDPQSFGTICCDHMLVADYRDGEWTDVQIEPYGPLPLPSSISALQYGISVFEGHKAFQTVDGEVVLFRPDENCARLRRSCRRLVLPEVPEEIYIEGLRQLIRIDREWVPGPDEGSLYIRPSVFATDQNIRVRPPSSCRFVIFTCAVGHYYPEPLKLLVTTDYVRAFPGGTGGVKSAGNYAPALLAEREAQRRGFHGVLWLDGRERRFVEEAGVMNVFFVIDGTVVTPSLGGTILPGITRDSVIALLAAMGIDVQERLISIDEAAEAHAADRLRECFGTGTAATIAHIAEIGYRDKILTLPPVADGDIAPTVLARMTALRTGREPDRFGWLSPV